MVNGDYNACQVHSMHHGSQHSNSWPCRGYLPLREGIHALDGATVTQPPRERLLQLTLLGGTGLRGLATPVLRNTDYNETSVNSD